VSLRGTPCVASFRFCQQGQQRPIYTDGILTPSFFELEIPRRALRVFPLRYTFFNFLFCRAHRCRGVLREFRISYDVGVFRVKKTETNLYIYLYVAGLAKSMRTPKVSSYAMIAGIFCGQGQECKSTEQETNALRGSFLQATSRVCPCFYPFSPRSAVEYLLTRDISTE